MKKYILFILSVFILYSCSFTKPLNVNTTYYEIHPPIHLDKTNIRLNKTISVKYSQCSPRFDSELFFYKGQPYGFKPYINSKWIDSVCNMLESSIIDAINKSHLFKRAQSIQALSTSDYQLEFYINKFEPVFKNNSKFVIIDIFFTTTDKKTNKVIDNYEFEEKLPINKLNMQCIVTTMNKAAQDSIISLIKRLKKISLRKIN